MLYARVQQLARRSVQWSMEYLTSKGREMIHFLFPGRTLHDNEKQTQQTQVNQTMTKKGVLGSFQHKLVYHWRNDYTLVSGDVHIVVQNNKIKIIDIKLKRL